MHSEHRDVEQFFFPDNTVLINFHIIDRFDVLTKLVAGKAAWVRSVERECSRSERIRPGLYTKSASTFGPAIDPRSSELLTTQALRQDLAKPGEERTKHLGEAETVAVIISRFAGSRFITDDRDAHDLARSQDVPIATYGTLDLLDVAERLGMLGVSTCAQVERDLKAAERHPRRWVAGF